MKKKKGAGAAGAAKGRKTGAATPKGAGRATARPASASTGSKAAVRRLRSELARALALIEELKASAETDFLLDILNRRGFERELNRSIAFIKRYHASAALIVLDVDRLKPINDAFGHAAGDQVLKAVVTALLGEVRASMWSAGSAATSSRCCCGTSTRPTRRPRRPPWSRPSTACASNSAAAS